MRGISVGPIAEISGDFWMFLFFASHFINENGPKLLAWPNGACLLEQEIFLVDAFQIIKSEVIKIISEQRKEIRGRR